MVLSDLPDISDDEWSAYQADEFRRATQPLADSSAFLQMTEPMAQSAYGQIDALRQQALAQQQMQSGSGLTGGTTLGTSPRQQPPASAYDSGLDGVTQPQDSMPYFGGQQTDPTHLYDELTSFGDDGHDGLPNYKQPQAQPQQAPKPEENIFSDIGQGLDTWAQQQRQSGFSQTPVLGSLVTGAAQGAANTMNSLGGSDEAIRQGLKGDLGQLGMGLLGTAGATINAPGELTKGIAHEAQAPTQMLPFIQPDTPVLGGLNNMQELAGMAPGLLIPQTALERGVFGAAERAAKPAIEGAASLGRGALDALTGTPLEPALGAVTRTAQRVFHGTGETFDRMRPGGGMLGEGVYVADRPEPAEGFAWNRTEDLWSATKEENQQIRDQLASLDTSPNYASDAERAQARQRLQDELTLSDDQLQQMEQSGDVPAPGVGAQVRPINLPAGMNILDSNEPVTPELVDTMLNGLRYGLRPVGQSIPSAFRDALVTQVRDDIARGRAPQTFDIYEALSANLSRYFANRAPAVADEHVLRSMMNREFARQGYDGISYSGGLSAPGFNQYGDVVPHTETAIFPSSQDKLTNMLSGMPGGVVRQQAERRYHGSATPYDRVDPDRFDPEGLYGPGYYTTSSPRIAQSYTEEARGAGNYLNGTPDPWSVRDAQGAVDALDQMLAGRIGRATDPRAAEYYTAMRDALPRDIYERNGYVYQRTPTYGDPSQFQKMPNGEYLPFDMNDVDALDSHADQASSDWMSRYYAANPQTSLDYSAMEPLRDASDDFMQMRQDLRGAYVRGPQANLRPVDVPAGVRLLDIDNHLGDDEYGVIEDWLSRNVPDDAAAFPAAVRQARAYRMNGSGRAMYRHLRNNSDILGADYYNALEAVFNGDRAKVNAALSDMGFDGITHGGGNIRPLLDDQGRPILHQVDVIFPDKLDKVNNALSGRPGGATSAVDATGPYDPQSAYLAQQAGRTALTRGAVGAAGGGVAGFASDPNADPGERIRNTLVGAAAGAAAFGGGTVAGTKALHALVDRGLFDPERLATHPDLENRVRAIMLAAADNTPDGEVVPVPALVSALQKLTGETLPDDVQRLVSGDLTTDEVRDLVSQGTDGQGLMDTIKSLFADTVTGSPSRGMRGAETAADVAAVYPGRAPGDYEGLLPGQSMVDEIARRMGVEAPRVQIISGQDAPGAWMLPTTDGGHLLQINDGLYGLGLSRDELADLFAHEIGHATPEGAMPGTNALGIPAGARRSPRQGIPDFGDVRRPITPEEWEPMTPGQRRAARNAAEAGRAYRARPRSSASLQAAVEAELPEHVPDTTPEPPAEPAGDVLQRVLDEMTPEGKAAAQQFAESVQSRVPWATRLVDMAGEQPPEGGARWDRIAELASQGEEQGSGDAVKQAMDDADAAATYPYQNPEKLTARQRERLGNITSLTKLTDLTPEAQEVAKRLTDQTLKDMVEAHGYTSEEQARLDAQKILPEILQFARTAKPNEPVNQALLRAGRQARANAIQLSIFADMDHQNLLNDPNASEEARASAKQVADLWDAASQVLNRYGGEIAPSEAGRTFRSMQDLPESIMQPVGGGDFGQPTNKAKMTPREKAFETLLSKARDKAKQLSQGKTTGEQALGRAQARVAGRRTRGPLADLGIEWADVMRREPDDTVNRFRTLAGLQELGGRRMRRDWTPKAMALDYGDKDAVEQFWKDARAAAGYSPEGDPLVQFNPNVSGQSYLGAADTITKSQMQTLLSKKLQKDADDATLAVRQARTQGLPQQQVSALEDTAKEAYARMGLNVDQWPADSYPIVSRALDSVRDTIEKRWPADRPKLLAGANGAMEDVATKRELLGLFDQEIKKQQKVAGLPVSGLQDLMSFGTSNALMSGRYVQAALLESMQTALNQPLQDFLRGNYGAAGQRLAGMARAFGVRVPGTDDLLKLGEGIRAPAMANALKALRGPGEMQSALEMRNVAEKGLGMVRSDSQSVLGRVLSPMHRVSRAMAEAFQTGNYFGEVNRLTHEASETGLLPGGKRLSQITDAATGATRNPTPGELFGNLPQQIVDEGLRASKQMTEGGHADWLESKIGEMKGLLTKPNATSGERAWGLFGNLMFPFVYGMRPAIRTGYQVATSPIRHPIQIAQALRRGDTGEAAYVAKKFALANSFNGYLAYNVMSGNITGHGPQDASTRQALMEATDDHGDPIWRPDSIRVPSPDGGHFWVKYTSMPGPVSVVSSVMANMYEAYAYDGKKLETPGETAGRMAQSVIPSYLDNTYFRDFLNLSDALNANGGVGKALQVGGQILGRFVPASGALRTAATISDPYERVTANPAQDLATGVPGARQLLPAEVSPYTGRAVEQGISPVTALGGISGNVYASPSQKNPMANQVASLSRRPLAGPWDWANPATQRQDVQGPRFFSRGEQARGTDFAGQRQTPEAIRGAQQAYGTEAGRQLLPVLLSKEYQALSPEQQAKRITDIVGSSGTARDAADWAAQDVAKLAPDKQVEHVMGGQPRFYGVSPGAPADVAAQNQRIQSARNTLAKLSQYYGRNMAIQMLGTQSPETLQLALNHPAMAQDLLWMQEQQERQALGVQDQAPEAVTVPDYGSGAGSRSIGPLTGGLVRTTLPPSLRRLVQ